MTCYKHEPYHRLSLVPEDTAVLLDREPGSPTAPVTIYLWKPSPGGCEQHNTETTPDVSFTHTGKLAKDITGFVRKEVCRETASGERELLYAYPGMGADVKEVTAAVTPVC